LYRKLAEMVQCICSLYVKGKVCRSLQAAALILPRRKLPGQEFLNFSSYRQSCFLPLQGEFLLQSRLINSLLCTILFFGSCSTVPAVSSAVLDTSQKCLKSRSPPGAAPSVSWAGCAARIPNC